MNDVELHLNRAQRNNAILCSSTTKYYYLVVKEKVLVKEGGCEVCTGESKTNKTAPFVCRLYEVRQLGATPSFPSDRTRKLWGFCQPCVTLDLQGRKKHSYKDVL